MSVSETESMWPCTCMSMWAVNMFCVCEICGKIQIGAIDVAQYNIAFTFVRLTFYKSIHKPNAKNTQMNNTDENFECVFPVWYGLDYGLPQVPVWLLPISQFHERLFLNNADFKWRMVFSGFYFGCYASRRSFLLLFSFVAFVCFVFRLSYSHGTLVNGICFQYKRRTTCVVLKKKKSCDYYTMRLSSCLSHFYMMLNHKPEFVIVIIFPPVFLFIPVPLAIGNNKFTFCTTFISFGC